MLKKNLGVMAFLGAAVLWGVILPIFAWSLKSIPITEFFSHRIVWAVLFLAAVVIYKGLLVEGVKVLLLPQNRKWILIATVANGVNWAVWLWAVLNSKLSEAGLGYLFSPLISVFFASQIAGEKISKTTRIALAIGLLSLITIFFELNHIPWISIIIGIAWATYGLSKNRVKVVPLVSITFEAACLFVPCLIYLLFVSQNSVITTSFELSMKLIGYSILTCLPFFLYGIAAQNLTVSTLGFLNYIPALLQILVAITYNKETLSPQRTVMFALVVVALAIFTFGQVRARK
jgi:chloramphenicol-sensitive protein RarD